MFLFSQPYCWFDHHKSSNLTGADWLAHNCRVELKHKAPPLGYFTKKEIEDFSRVPHNRNENYVLQIEFYIINYVYIDLDGGNVPLSVTANHSAVFS